MKKTPVYLRMVVAFTAALIFLISARADEITLAWRLAPGARPYLGTGNNERGFAYNPATGHLLLVSRTAPISVWVLDAATGDEIMVDGAPKTLNLTGVSGGTFIISQIRCTADGVIYAANLTTSTTAPEFKIYRWANENAAPTVAYQSNPGGGTAQPVRWGDTFNIRGTGNDTQLIAAAGASGGVNYRQAAVFSTTDNGETFTSTLLPDVGDTGGSQGIAFGTGNTIWAKRTAGSLRHVSFDLANASTTLLNSYPAGAVGPLSTGGKYLAGVAVQTPDEGRVYDISDTPNAPVLVGALPFATDNANSNTGGAADIGGGKAFFLDTNNGLLAVNLIERTDPVTIFTQPSDQHALYPHYTGTVAFSVTASGTPPIRYQWYKGDTLLEGQTASTLTLGNLTLADSGEYWVRVSNALGPVDSARATLRVLEPLDGANLQEDWQILPGDRAYVQNDTNARGVAYNHVTGHVLVVSRTGGTAVHILDAETGLEVMAGDPPAPMRLPITAIITGGTFNLNMIDVADDGVIYAANLTTDAATTAFKVYRWASETADPETVFTGNPSNGGATRPEDLRYGDNFDVRGSGVDTQILVASRNGRFANIIFPNDPLFGFATSSPINVADAPDGSIGMGVAFAEGNSFYATALGHALRLITYPDPFPAAGLPDPLAGTVSRVFPASEVRFSISHLAYDTATRLLAANALDNPDTVELYRIAENGSAELIDQEVLGVNNNNGNGTGSLDFGPGVLVALNTQNGIIKFNVDPAVIAVGARLSIPMRNGDGSFTFTFTGTRGMTYAVEATSNWTQWDTVETATVDATGVATVTDNAAVNHPYRFYRVVKR